MNSSEQLQREESELVGAARLGDRLAMKEIYEQFSPRMYNLISYWTGDDIAAQDLLQIVFMKVFKGLAAFKHEASLSTWIYRIAANECSNHASRVAGRYAPLESILGSDRELAPGPGPDERHATTEKEEIVRQAVLGLSPKLRAVVVMRYNEGMSYEEIAEILGCSAGTVASRLSRALSRLDARLKPLRGIL
ncbi:MAG TPA: sigma-70 family RNA polymerase sigma factor [Blastocatellia bacterium]|nr:sigma-70 family RNA polymerase sigma factor [Blastocatellia bacterium]